MTKSQTNLKRMFMAVLESLNKHVSEFAGDLGLMASRDRLATFLAQLEVAAKLQKLITIGLSRTRKLLEKVLVAETLSLCSALFRHGEVTANAHLMAIADLKASELHKMRKPELVELVGALCDEASPILGPLSAYGFGALEQTRLRATLASYLDAVNAHRVAVNEKVAATATIKTVIRLMTQLMKKESDNQMKKYEGSAPRFFIAYNSARKVVDLGIRYETEPADLTQVVITPANEKEVTGE